MSKKYEQEHHHCVDCEKPIWRKSIRCSSCSYKNKRNRPSRKWVNAHGYEVTRLSREHPYFRMGQEFVNCSRVSVHRLVMAEHLGRLLTSDEIVHHIDGNRLNNNIENLELFTNAEHKKHHSRTIRKLEAEIKYLRELLIINGVGY